MQLFICTKKLVLIILVVVTFFSCTKTGVYRNDEITEERITNRFFNLPENVSSLVKQIADTLKKQNAHYHFINQLINEEGYALWGKAIIDKGYSKKIITSAVATAGNATPNYDVVLIPLVLDNSNYVNSFLICTVDTANVGIELIRGRTYDAYKYPANDVAMQMLVLNNSAFGDSIFTATNDTVFNIGEQQKISGQPLFIKITAVAEGTTNNGSSHLNRPTPDEIAIKPCTRTIFVNSAGNFINSAGEAFCSPVIITVTDPVGGTGVNPENPGTTTTPRSPNYGSGTPGAANPNWMPNPTTTTPRGGTTITKTPLPPLVPVITKVTPTVLQTSAIAFDNRITDELVPCMSAVLQQVKNVQSGNLGMIIQKFAGEVPLWNINFKNGPLTENYGETSPIITNNTVQITLDYDKLKNATNIAIAQIIIHEVIHAYLTNYYKNDPTNFVKDYPLMVDEFVNKGFSLNVSEHDQMVKSFTSSIADALKDYGKSVGLNIPYQVYEDLAWTGLDFLNNSSLTDEEKDRIQNRISAEFSNSSFDTEVPLGKKACN